jgi:hypothetical protein
LNNGRNNDILYGINVHKREKKMKKTLHFLKNLIIFTYILVIIFVTICLLSYNDYKVTEFGTNTLVPVIDKDLEPDYTAGDLLIISKNRLAEVKIGDTVFFYRTYMGETTINYATVTNLERVTDTETTFTVSGDYQFSSSYFIGKTSTATVIPVVGRILGILESKFGFLFLGVFPSLIVFLYTAYTLFIEVKDGDEEENDEEKSNSTEKTKQHDKVVANKTVESTILEKQNEIESKNVEQKNIEQKDIEQKDIEKEDIEQEDIKQENVELENIEQKNIKQENSEQEKVEQKNVEQEINVQKLENKEVKVEKENQPKQVQENKKEEVSKKKEETPKIENKKKELTEEEKKALIESKMKTMTEEQKKALIEAKLKTMTDEQKRALIEAKRKKLEAEKSKK